MQDKEAVVGLYNPEGILVGEKKRGEIDKTADLLKTINVILFNEYNRIFLVKSKGELWNGLWGGSCSGIVRTNEDLVQAATRTLNRELGYGTKLTQVSEKYYDFDNVRRIMSVFVGRADDKDIVLSQEDFSDGRWFELDEVKKMIENKECMPTLEAAIKELNIS